MIFNRVGLKTGMSLGIVIMMVHVFIFGLLFAVISFIGNKSAIDIKSGDYTYVYATVDSITDEMDKHTDESIPTVYVKYEVDGKTYVSSTDLSYIEYNVGDSVKLLCDLSDPNKVAYEDEILTMCFIIGVIIMVVTAFVFVRILFCRYRSQRVSARKMTRPHLIPDVRFGLVIIGLLFMSIAVCSNLNLFKLKCGAGESTRALITDIDKHSEYKHGEYYHDYDVYILYTVDDQIYTTELNIYEPSMYVGKNIDIIYEIGNPRNVTMDSYVIYVFIGIGAFVTLVGIILLFIPRRRISSENS